MHLDAFPVNFRQAMYTTRFPRMHIWTNAEPYTGLRGERVNTIHTGEHYEIIRAVVTGNEAKLRANFRWIKRMLEAEVRQRIGVANPGTSDSCAALPWRS